MILIFGLTWTLASLPFGTPFEWEDFSNNLATDLAPLITLFGEQVTKQFLSESLSTWDNIIFAMAPLGILTAVVSVIRVCGHSSLRAFIGRAQESPGTAEVELLSSVSETTSELWHNGGVARVFGTPQILEVVRLTGANRELHYTGVGCTAGIYSLRESAKESISAWRTESDSPLKDIEYCPNISLNFGMRRLPKRYTYGATVLGIVLQAGVLIFAGLTVYRYPSQFLVGSDGKQVERYAFSFTLVGTMLLCSGMFLCAFIIEKNSSEQLFQKNPKIESRIYWVQPGGQKIGDQVFESFVQFSDSSDYIVSATASKLLAFHQFNKLLWVAVSTTVFGFIVQFVGLRAIHASVIMAQLGATILMAIVRAGLRAQRVGGDKNLVRWPSSYIKGHELDFAAMEYEDIVSLCVSQWYEGGLSGTPALVEGKGAMALKARARFARLTNGQDHRSWNNLQVRELASQVQRAIEGIMGIFFNLPASGELYPRFRIEGDQTPNLRLVSSSRAQPQPVYPVWIQRKLHLEEKLVRPHVDRFASRTRNPVEHSANPVILNCSEYSWDISSPRFDLFGCQTPYNRPDTFEDFKQKVSISFVATENSRLVMCAQDILISFLGAVLRDVEGIGGETTLRASVGRQPTFQLQNSQIEEMADYFENSGLGSREDAYMCIIPTLMRENKMPEIPNEVIIAALDQLKSCSDKEREEAVLLLECVCFDPNTNEDRKPYAELAEIYHEWMRTSDSTSPSHSRDGFSGVGKMLEQAKNRSRDSTLSIIAQRYGWIGLQIAKEKGNEEQAANLRSHGVTEDDVPNHKQLWEWAQENNTKVIVYLVGKNANDVDAPGPNGRTSLSWAAFHGNVDVVALLLKNNADRNIRDGEGYTPLMLATEQGHHGIVEALLNGDTSSLNTRLKIGMTPLMLAAKRGDNRTVRLLLEQPDIEINARSGASNHHRSAFDFAFLGEHLEIVELLLEKKAYVSYVPEVILWWGNDKGSRRVVDLMIEKGVDYAEVFWAAAEQQNWMVVESVIKQKKVDASIINGARSGDKPLLSLAAGNSDIAELLIKEGMFSRKDLVLAASAGHLNLVELLIDNGVGFTPNDDVNENKGFLQIDHALLLAVEAGHREIAGLILDRTGRIQGEALERADHNDMVELLLDKGVDIAVYGAKAAMKAGRNGSVDIMGTLISKGLDISNCEVAFEGAASAGHTEMVKFLIEKGIDIKTFGEKALNGAVSWGQDEVIKVLLANGIGSEDSLQQATENRRRLSYQQVVTSSAKASFRFLFRIATKEHMSMVREGWLDRGGFVDKL
ncbi:hypothetical protein TWF788_006265 [Orbilia oligospora]|uniref:Uncharacterized protein n=1 Tax=Orbilia oligospora TaxID=2813651 RepID=A0A7C8PWR6_ORBOL|nr:hypothetical protein TWF788_006265 [Orbilia oligospora]